MYIFFSVMIVGTLLGVAIPGILVYGLIIEPARLRRMWKRENIKVKKKKITFKDVTSGIVVLSILSAVTIFSIYLALPEWKDLPSLITGNYPTAVGTIDSNMKIHHSGRSWGYEGGITVNNGKYWYSGIVIPQEGTPVSVKYLPHTKCIVKIGVVQD